MIQVGFGLQESRLVTAFRRGPSVRLESLSPKHNHLLLWLYGLVSGPESFGLLLACCPLLSHPCHRWHHAPVRHLTILQDLARVISTSSWLAGSYVFTFFGFMAHDNHLANMTQYL